jgi:outer membrane immunogenic protein
MKRAAFLGSALVMLAAASPASAADMPLKAPPPVVDPWTWTGVYAGVNGGWSWGRADTAYAQSSQTIGTITTTTLGGAVLGVTTIAGPVVTTALADNARMDGWLGGIQVGHNWQFNQWLVGLEGDFQLTDQRGGSTFCDIAGCGIGSSVATTDFHLDWFGTIRGRAGWIWDNRLLLYATGGLAVGHVSADYNLAVNGLAPNASFRSRDVQFGYVGGGGGEYRFTPRWSFKVEYLYMDLGSVDAALSTSATSPPLIFTVGDQRLIAVATSTYNALFNTELTDHVVRGGINYRF